MTQSHPTPSKPMCRPCWGLVLVALVFVAFGFAGVAMVVDKVLSGNGLQHCCTIEGVAFNYLAVFILLCGIALVLLLGLLLQFREWRQQREFERRYGVKAPAKDGGSAAHYDQSYGSSLHGYEDHDSD